MVVEIQKSLNPWVYGRYDDVGFDFATFFSSSTHFDIIDSYSTHYNQNKAGAASYTTMRHKGDPIADDDPAQPGYKFWETSTDVGEAGDFIVIECKTSALHSGLGTTLPKWQVKAQWHGNSYYYDVSDPTGTIYTNSYWNRDLRWRMCPWGGWDFDNSIPDFKPASRSYPASFDNYNSGLSHGGSGATVHWYIVADDGCFYLFSKTGQEPFNIRSLGGFFGDVRPSITNSLPNPRAYLVAQSDTFYLAGMYSSRMLCEGSYSSTFPTSGGIIFPDHNENVIVESFKVPSGTYIVSDGLTVPNRHSSTLDLDTFPFIPMPVTTRGAWFDIPQIRKGWGVGHCLVSNKEWLSTGDSYCTFLKWDGITNL